MRRFQTSKNKKSKLTIFFLVNLTIDIALHILMYVYYTKFISTENTKVKSCETTYLYTYKYCYS